MESSVARQTTAIFGNILIRYVFWFRGVYICLVFDFSISVQFSNLFLLPCVLLKFGSTHI